MLIIEAKFWAGLTENQPNAYIKRLPNDRDSVLLFIAPAVRLYTLWPEILRRCQQGKIKQTDIKKIGDGLHSARITNKQCLALGSWRSVPSAMIREIDIYEDYGISSDLRQLKGLCDKMDTEAFLPLRSEELSSTIGRRVYQFCELVDDVTERLKTEKLISTKGQRASAWIGHDGKYMIINNYGCFLCFSAERWSDW